MAAGQSLSDVLARAAVDHAPDGIVIVDDRERIVYVNRQAEVLFGATAGELEGRPVEVLLPEDLRRAHRGHVARYRSRPVNRPMGVGRSLPARRSDGTTFPAEISLSPIDTPDGRHTIAVVRDVTERERAAQALRHAEETLLTVAERERIARDLHDTVIQHLFAVGMTLSAAESQLGDGAPAERLRWAIEHLDETIVEIRSAIFGLRSEGEEFVPRSAPPGSSPLPEREERR